MVYNFQHLDSLTSSHLRLPSIDTMATVRWETTGKIYAIYFHGKGKNKWLGLGWKKFVLDHNLRVGHRLKFKRKVFERGTLELEVSTFIQPSKVPLHSRTWAKDFDPLKYRNHVSNNNVVENNGSPAEHTEIQPRRGNLKVIYSVC